MFHIVLVRPFFWDPFLDLICFEDSIRYKQMATKPWLKDGEVGTGIVGTPEILPETR